MAGRTANALMYKIMRKLNDFLNCMLENDSFPEAPRKCTNVLKRAFGNGKLYDLCYASKSAECHVDFDDKAHGKVHA